LTTRQQKKSAGGGCSPCNRSENASLRGNGKRAQQMDGLIDGVSPRRTAAPNDAAAVAELLVNACDEKAVVVPRGGGTMLDLGAPLQRVDVALSLEKLDRVLDYQPANLTVRTEAGIALGELNRTLAAHSQFVPLDPPCPSRATIGGILATNASGPLRIRYGSARDLLIGIRVALPDGQIVKGGGQVVKNVAGYDLPKLFIGSLGTLGVIVEATFKLAPLPPKTTTLIAGFADLAQACAIAVRVLQSPLLPIGMMVLNRTASKQYELSDQFALAVRFGGISSAITRQLNDVTHWARSNGSAPSTTLEDDAALWSRLSDFAADNEIVLKVSVLPTQLEAIGNAAERLANQLGLACAFAANPVGILFVALKGDPEQVKSAVASLRESATIVGGHLVVHRAPRAVREEIDVWGPLQNSSLMRKLKQEFDPHGILNPGRFGTAI
jgi:glycolate oxidase FAD binding subunit